MNTLREVARSFKTIRIEEGTQVTHVNMRLLFCILAAMAMLGSVIGLGNTPIADDDKLHETGQFDGVNIDVQSNDNGITTKGVSEDEKVNSPLFEINVTYIPPDCPGGNCTLHLEIVTDDPTLVFFRWDFNNDSIMDTLWMTEKVYDLSVQNGLNFTICVEGWDGTSVKWVTYTGTNLNETTRDDWIQPPTNVGWKFKAKEEFVITHLGYWKNVTDYPSLSIKIWNFATQTVLASCKPLGTNNTTWHWCTLISPVSITYNTDYMLSCHKSSDIFPDWMVVQNQGFGWEKVEYFGYYYASGLPQRMPNIYVTNSLIPKCDFKWRQSFVIPDPQYTCTHCQNDTSAPTINDVRALPNPQEIFNDVNISAIVSDDLMLKTVSVNISSISGSTNVTMFFDEFNGRYYFSNSYHELGLYSFTIWASDSWDNWNSSDGSFWIQDTTPPIIQHAPISTNYVGSTTDITTFVSDNYLLQDVRLNYTDYNLVSHNITMTAIGQDRYTADIPAQASSGVIPYFVWAVDSNGNEERTQTYTVQYIYHVPSPPSDLIVTPEGYGALRLNWSAPSTNEDGSPIVDLAGFNIYRMSEPGGDRIKVNAALVLTQTYTDTALNDGTAYYYVVKAVNSYSVESDDSNEATGTTLTRPIIESDGALAIIVAVAIAVAFIIALLLILMLRRMRRRKGEQTP